MTPAIKLIATDQNIKNRHRLVLCYEDEAETETFLNESVGPVEASKLMRHFRSGFISGKYKDHNIVPAETGDTWTLVLGMGKRSTEERSYRFEDRIRSVFAIAGRYFRRRGVRSIAVHQLGALNVPAKRLGQLIAEGVLLGCYRFDRYKTKPGYTNLEVITIETNDVEVMQDGLKIGEHIARGTCLARDVINTPSSDMRPAQFLKIAKEMADDIPNLTVRSLNRAQMEAENMGLHLGVARGSHAEPFVCLVEYTPPEVTHDTWDLALVGKGVTFDCGGYDMKSSAGMRRMYRDMAGAGATLGAIRNIATLGVPLRVVAAMPLSENMINGEAFRPGDILTSRKGTTVEIANTDAEGRLVLADTLDYVCEHYEPDTVVDIATLTGAVRVALGLFVTGMITDTRIKGEDDEFAAAVTRLGHRSGEWVWRLPVDDAYGVQLSSKVADYTNCNVDAKSGAGTITAALFLRHFVDFKKVKRWVHFDIAATAFMERSMIYNRITYWPREGATGVGVRLLTEIAHHIAAVNDQGSE
jgi:leucyl aminopeptidase